MSRPDVRAPDVDEPVTSGPPVLVFRDFLATAPSRIDRMRWSFDGSLLAIQYHGGRIALWDVRNRCFSRTTGAEPGTFTWSPSGLHSARYLRRQIVIDDHTSKNSQTVPAERVVAIAWSPGGDALLYVSDGGSAVIHDIATRKRRHLRAPLRDVVEIAWPRPDRALLLTAKGVLLQLALDVEGAAPEAVEAEGAAAFAVHRGVDRLAVGRRDGSIVLRRLSDRETQGELHGHRARVVAASFSSDGSLLATRDASARTIVWQLAPTVAPLAFFDDSPELDEDGFLFVSPAISFSPASNELAVGSLTAQLWTVAPPDEDLVPEDVDRTLGVGSGRQHRDRDLRIEFYKDASDETIPERSDTVSLKSSAPYRVTFVGGTQVKERQHESVVESLVETLRRCGATLATRHPIDLAMTVPLPILFEVKHVGSSHPIHAVREAVGQILEYRYFLGPREAHACIVLDEPPRDPRLVEYVEEELKLLLLWFEEKVPRAGPTTTEVLRRAGIDLGPRPPSE